MFEWKPPDPRLVALVRRLEAAVLRWFPARDAKASTVGQEIEVDEPSNDAVRNDPPARDGGPRQR